MKTKKYKVFIPEPEWEESHEILKEIAEVEVGEPGQRYDEKLLMEKVKDADAVMITSQQKITRRIIENADKLKIIVKYGSKPSIDTVDIDAATKKGVIVSYTPGANADSVAEFTIGLILCILKKICYASYRLRSGLWRDKSLLGYELMGKTVGIIGLGQIGTRVAKKIQCFDVYILGYDPYVPKESLKKIKVKMTYSLEELLKSSDIVTIHAKLTDETYHLIDYKLKLMKRDAFLINTARGAIVDEKGLLKALKEGVIAGAALDVYEIEPPDVKNELLSLDNVLPTPHLASCTYEAYRREAYMAAHEVLRVLKGYKPKYIANPEVLKKVKLR